MGESAFEMNKRRNVMGSTSSENEMLKDGEIIELFLQRDESAIRQTDRKYRSYMLTVGMNILHDKADAEECLNDAYNDLWNAIPPEKPDDLQAYLAVIMRRKASNRYKAKGRQKRSPGSEVQPFDELEELIADGGEADAELMTKELSGLISRYIKGLPDRKMYIFVSRFYYAQPIDKIAKKLSVSRSTVNKEIAAMRNELKKELEREGYTV